MDMMSKGHLGVKHLRCLVLDEVDKIFSHGFEEGIYEIFELLAPKTQICLFSATFPHKISALTTKFMRDPARIVVKRDELTLEGIKQFYVAADEEWKIDVLCELYEVFNISQAIIYCNWRRQGDFLAREMTNRNFAVSTMHPELNHQERQLILREFRSGPSRTLISTDMLLKGFDNEVLASSLVINYDLPFQVEAYLYRCIGRRGPFGRKGTAAATCGQ